MSASTANSARYTREWLETRSSGLLTGEGPTDSGGETEGHATQLYRVCQRVLGGLCTRLPVTAREELAKLYLWGQSLGPEYLDIALEYSEDVCTDVLEALASIGKLLLQGSASTATSSSTNKKS